MDVSFFNALVIFCMFSILQSSTAENDKVDYKFVLDKLEKVIEADELLLTNISFDKKDDEILINGEMKQLIDVDNDWKINVTVFRADEVNGEYTKFMALPVKGVCDMMKSYYKMYFYSTLKNHANAPDPQNCPVTKENYIVKDYPLDSSKFKKFLKPGFYRISSSLVTNEAEKLKYEVYGHVEEVK